VLQLWNRRLQDIIDDLRNDPAAATGGKSSDELRNVEQEVRRHLAAMKDENLCATLAYRRFLDGLFEAIGIGQIEEELGVRLQAAEQLTDYAYQRAEQDHQRSEREHQEKELRAGQRRDILLFFITVTGIFGLSDYLALTDTRGHLWQDLLVVIIFGVFFVLGGAYVLFGERVGELLGKVTGKSGKAIMTRRVHSHEDSRHD